MNNGYIKIHRKLLDWEWYTDGNTLALWIHILINANHKTKKWRGITIERGSFLTSLNTLSMDTGLSLQNVRTSLKKLELTNNITSKTTNKYRIITVLKYNEYQDANIEDNKQLTSSQQTTNKQLTTTNNDKNNKNVKNETTIVEEESEQIPYKVIIDYLNQKANTNARHTTNDTRKKIQARWNEGFTLNDFKTAIDNAVKFRTNKDGTIDNQYLTPKTLFNGDFENRVNGSSYGWEPSKPQPQDNGNPFR